MDFKDVVKMVEDSEKRVDEMLKAARLERPKDGQWTMSGTSLRSTLSPELSQ